jgi:hypothetical protein
MLVPQRKYAYRPPGPVTETFIYVDDVRTSQETHLSTSTICYRASFTFTLFAVYMHVYNEYTESFVQSYHQNTYVVLQRT